MSSRATHAVFAPRVVLAATWLVLGLVLPVACGSSGGTPDADGPDLSGADTTRPDPDEGLIQPSTTPMAPLDGPSGVDLTGYDAAEVGPEGGVLSPDGALALAVPSGALTGAVTIGMRPSPNPPALPEGYTAASGWVDVAASQNGLMSADPAQPFILAALVDLPPEAAGSPGLQVVVALPGVTLPVSGAIDPSDGTFQAAIPGLPPAFSFCVAYNPAITRLYSEASAEPLRGPLGAEAGATHWSTFDFTLDFDSGTLTPDQAASVIEWAQYAAILYDDAGFREPLLVKDTAEGGFVLPPEQRAGKIARWHLHVIDDPNKEASFFDPLGEPLDSSQARQLGRIYLLVKNLLAPEEDPAGDGQFTVSHELFHAIFAAYPLPRWVLPYEGGTKSHDSAAGYNEGLATAAGYLIDKGGGRPVPGVVPSTLETALGLFRFEDYQTTYRNQDFFVYLLRVGELATLRRLVEGLVRADGTGELAQAETLVRYADALKGADLGLDMPFTAVWAAYVLDRGYLRTPMGYLWPEEPSKEEPGKPNAFSRLSFPHAVQDLEPFCTAGTVDGQARVTCNVGLIDVLPYSARALWLSALDPIVTGAFAGLPADQRSLLAATVKVIAQEGGEVGLWAFREKDGQGSAEGLVASPAGNDLVIPGAATDWYGAKVFVVRGAGKPTNLEVSVTYAPAQLGRWFYSGRGTWIESSGDVICSQEDVEMEAEVNHVLGTMQLDVHLRDVDWTLDAASDTWSCTLGATPGERQFDVHGPVATSGTFSIGYQSDFSGNLAEGTYDPSSFTGQGSAYSSYLDRTVTCSFDLARVP